MNHVYLTLPYPPAFTATYTSKGGVYLSDIGKEYRDEVRGWTQEVAPACCPFDRPVRVEMAVHPPDNRRRDLDNIQKVVFDALTEAGIWTDDSKVVDIHAWKDKVEPGGSIHVEVEPA